MIDERKIELMTRLIDEYIASAHPVGSLMLAERYRLSWSTATIRNEMALLEEQGYMFQPYTSSGRVPTQRGYRLYIQYMRPARLSAKAIEQLRAASQSLEKRSPRSQKQLARTLADISGEIAFVSDGADCVFSGLRHLVEKPEFYDEEFMQEVVSIVDTFNETLEELSAHLDDQPEMFIGDARRFGRTCSVLVTTVIVNSTPFLVGLLGPLRMNYSKNMALLKLLSNFSQHN